MVTILKSVQFVGGQYVEGFALSSDTLPTAGIVNGSKMEVLNASAGTITEYRFNQASAAWVGITAAAASAAAEVEEVGT